MSTKAKDVVILKLPHGEQIIGKVVIPLIGRESSPFDGVAISLEDVGSVQIIRDRNNPNPAEFGVMIVPLMVDFSYFALDQVVSIGPANATLEGQHQKTFGKILTPSINDVARVSVGGGSSN
jgi:hypothetical protein